MSVIAQDSLVFLDQPAENTRKSLRRTDVMLDLFCGAGGSGGGLLDACDLLGRHVQGHFVNHWDRAIEIHAANHPGHKHYEEDLFLLDPASMFPENTYCSLLWGSPQCTFFSIARGAACVNEQDRSHAHSVTDWIKHLRPEGVLIENVREFTGWSSVIQSRDARGELVWTKNTRPAILARRLRRHKRTETEEQWSARMAEEGYKPHLVPDKTKKGEYFRAWIAEVEALGYVSDHRILCSADYGDPTIRKRLFVYFCRKDSGKKIVWPLPTHQKPAADGSTGGLPRWRTARDIIDWAKKGTSVFSRKKTLARNTFRRLAIGLVKYGMRDFLVPNFGEKAGQEPRTHSLDGPLPTVTSHGAGGLVEPSAYILPSHRGFVDGNTRSVDSPVTTLTTKSRAEGLVEPQAFVLPKDQGWDKQNVKGVDVPVSTVTTTHTGEMLVQPAIVQMKGQSTAQSIDTPLTVITGQPGHYVMTPLLDSIRGTGVASGVDEPCRTVCAGGQHQAIAEAFMLTIDQTGGVRANHGTYSADDPVHTIVTKANASCIVAEIGEVQRVFLENCKLKGVDTSRAETFLGFLMDELRKTGRADVKPWIYVYYGAGNEGALLDSPLPTVTTRARSAICFPVIELEGRMLRIDLLYRMLSTLELQRAMGFPDRMEWAGATQEEKVKAIGNSVSHGVARALGLAWYSQDPDVGKYINYEENT